MMPFPISKATVARSSARFRHRNMIPAQMFQGFVGHNHRRKTARTERETEPSEGVAISFELVESNFKSVPNASEIALQPPTDGRILGGRGVNAGGHTDALGQWPRTGSHFCAKTSAALVSSTKLN